MLCPCIKQWHSHRQWFASYNYNMYICLFVSVAKNLPQVFILRFNHWTETWFSLKTTCCGFWSREWFSRIICMALIFTVLILLISSLFWLLFLLLENWFASFHALCSWSRPLPWPWPSICHGQLLWGIDGSVWSVSNFSNSLYNSTHCSIVSISVQLIFCGLILMLM